MNSNLYVNIHIYVYIILFKYLIKYIVSEKKVEKQIQGYYVDCVYGIGAVRGGGNKQKKIRKTEKNASILLQLHNVICGFIYN